MSGRKTSGEEDVGEVAADDGVDEVVPPSETVLGKLAGECEPAVDDDDAGEELTPTKWSRGTNSVLCNKPGGGRREHEAAAGAGTDVAVAAADAAAEVGGAAGGRRSCTRDSKRE